MLEEVALLTTSDLVSSSDRGLSSKEKLRRNHILANNCTDRTVDRARVLEAAVCERHDVTFRGKGYALRECFDLLLPGSLEYEGLVVVDPDKVVSNNSPKVMNFDRERVGKANQCSDAVEPQPGSWSPEMTRAGFMLSNSMRLLGRWAMRYAAGLPGNGMCISADTLRQISLQAYLLSEDL
jgi:hypothetical protein